MQAMIPSLDQWQPLPVPEIQSAFGDFDKWVLCGGRSIDWILGTATREHDDTDVGVFRSDVVPCLNLIERSRVYLCDPPGQLSAWDGTTIPPHVHDIWITNKDRNHWAIQLMVYDDNADTVRYRRDPRITWPKSQHAITIRGIRVLNPMVTALFKLHRHDLQEKDCLDICTLISALANTRLNV